MGLLPKIARQTDEQRQAVLARELIRKEAIVGGTLFGPVPSGHRRDFFCLDQHTWIWHEEWVASGQRQAITTRYDVRPNGVLKSQVGQPYQRLSATEASNFYHATQLYGQRITAEYQRQLATN